MNYITYYLGAGASVHALPLYNDFQLRLEIFRDFIYHYQLEKDKEFKKKAAVYLNSLDTLIKKLNATETTTLDVLASELYEQRFISADFSFNKLKYLISDFFVFEQLEKSFPVYKKQVFDSESIEGYKTYSIANRDKVNTSIDNRYRAFINSEIKNGKFPSHINIISWNYDLQVELAYSRMIQGVSLYLSQRELQIFPSPEIFSEVDNTKSRIIKLNGTAGVFYTDNERKKLENFIDGRTSFDYSYIDFMIEIFSNNYHRIFGGYPFFTFSFEKDGRNKTNEAIAHAEEILKNTDILIILGYSFHPANREIDTKVFERSTKLKKVYIQTPTDTDFRKIKFNFSKIKPSFENIEHYEFVNEFLASNNV